jgi:hypothetical protein
MKAALLFILLLLPFAFLLLLSSALDAAGVKGHPSASSL